MLFFYLLSRLYYYQSRLQKAEQELKDAEGKLVQDTDDLANEVAARIDLENQLFTIKGITYCPNVYTLFFIRKWSIREYYYIDQNAKKN